MFFNVVFILWTSLKVEDMLVFIGQLLISIKFLFWINIYKLCAFYIIWLGNVITLSKLVNRII